MMRVSRAFVVAALTCALLASGCQKETPVEGAVDSAKDALDMREHEKLKDAGEEAKEAIDDAVEGVKDAVEGN